MEKVRETWANYVLRTAENWLLGCSFREAPKLIPGILLSAAIAAVAIPTTALLNNSLKQFGAISFIVMALFIGMLLRNFAHLPSFFFPGIAFSLRKLLRLGIILMGIRLSLLDAVKIGGWGIPLVLSCVAAGLVLTVLFGKAVKLPDRLATLIAVGTSICGASAIVATAPGIKAREEEVTYAVATITVFGLLAMVAYPLLAHLLFHGNSVMAGLFLGTAIHETAQVAGAGFAYDTMFASSSLGAADVAMVTKLVRNAFMAVVIPALTVWYIRTTMSSETTEMRAKRIFDLFPLFILGFLLTAAIRSLGDAGIHEHGLALGTWNEGQWKAMVSGVMKWSGYFLATAMAGVGLGTSFAGIKAIGFRPFIVGLFSAAMVGTVAFAVVQLLGEHFTAAL